MPAAAGPGLPPDPPVPPPSEVIGFKVLPNIELPPSEAAAPPAPTDTGILEPPITG